MMVDTVIAVLSYHTDSVVVVANAGNAGSLLLPIPSKMYGTKPLVLIGIDESNTIVDLDSVMVAPLWIVFQFIRRHFI